MERNYYMVRAMHSQKEEIDLFLNKGVVGVGWSYLDFTSFEEPELLEMIRKREGNKDPRVVGRKLAEIQRFLNIRKGDIIIVPRPGCISIAQVTGDHVYDEGAKSLDLANQIQVSFLKDKNSGDIMAIPRAELQEKLQRRLGARGFTVLNLNACGETIKHLMAGETTRSMLENKEETLREQFKEQLLKRIQSGETYIKSHGTGLEELLKELLICEGYSAFIPSKRNSKGIGDIDLKAEKSDKFGTTTLLIQAKHHEGQSGVYGVKQLEEAVRQLREDAVSFNDPICWFITTANSVSAEAQSAAEEAGIEIMVGKDFVDWVYDNIGNLSESTRKKLGISTIPQFL